MSVDSKKKNVKKAFYYAIGNGRFELADNE